MKENETIDLPPSAPDMMESTRAIGYSAEAAVADLIDNSIAASATSVEIDYFPIDSPYISIFDNGNGMSRDELVQAMRYGSRSSRDVRDERDLGRYGLGLKTASMSQCRVLTVISKKDGETFGCQWNLDKVIESNGWSLIVIDEDDFASFQNFGKLNEAEHGTLVVWQNFDRFAVGYMNVETAFREKMDAVREHLSLVFHRYMSGEPGLLKLSIYMNGSKVTPQDPFLVSKSTQVMDEETFDIRGSKIKVKPYVLPHPSKLSRDELKALGGDDNLKKTQGFYVYRNKRLLVWGTWFRMLPQRDLTKLSRVQVDIPNSLDDLWELDIRKSSATPPEDVRNNLRSIIDRIADGSRRVWTFRGKKETSDKIVHIWNRMRERNGSVFYEINKDHPVIENFLKSYPDSERYLLDILRQIELSVPFNQIYADMGTDEKILNGDASEFEPILKLMKTLLDSQDTASRRGYYESMISVEPFCDFKDELDKALEGERYFD